MEIICPICGSNNTNPQIFREKGIFEGWNIERYQCMFCDVIFGPSSMINMPIDKLSSMYKSLYSRYGEGETTQYEIATFKLLNPKKQGKYLNYGAGKWSKSIEILRKEGYNIIGYEPFCPSGSDAVKTIIAGDKFDGIMSHNVIEHFQNPINSLIEMKNMLTENALMAHSTECYSYKYAESEYHLFFFIRRSIDVLCKKTDLRLIKRPGECLVVSNQPYQP